VVPNVIEKAGHGGREKEYLSAGWSPRAKLRKMGRNQRTKEVFRHCSWGKDGGGDEPRKPAPSLPFTV